MGKKKNERNDKMEKSAEDYQAEYKNITIKTTDGSTIYGKINIGEKERVSDIFISNKSLFVVMVDVSYKENVGKTMFNNNSALIRYTLSHLNEKLSTWSFSQEQRGSMFWTVSFCSSLLNRGATASRC